MWVLHAGRITDFDGTFGEWETASAERAHAASIAAEEEEHRRLLLEKQRTRKTKDAERENQAERRVARRKLNEAESRVAELEGRIAQLTAELEQPDLYTTVEGGKRAAGLGQELDGLKRLLDQAFEVWALAQNEVER